ncbi:MAG: hybrid sensor histidine kinase/response regulator, partial [Vicinamibacteria bacterium]
LVKPFSARELLARVGAMLSLAKAREESFRREEELRAETFRIQRENEEALRQRYDELQTIYDTTPAGMCLLDRELRYVRINDRLAEMNGIPARDHIGKTVREMVPDLADEVEPAFLRIMETGDPVIDIELRGETKAQPGVERTWLESWYPLRDASGQVVGVNIVAMEITEQKRTEEALRETDAKLRLSHKAAGAGTWTWDQSTGMVSWSEETYDLFGIDPGVPVSDDIWREAVHADDVESAERATRQAVDRREDLDVEYRIHHRHRGERWLRSKGRIMDPVNRPGIMTGITLDVTERKRAEVALREADRRKDEFLAILAHELRNPLAPIRTGLELIRLAGNDPQSVERTRAMIERQVAHMVRLIDDLLDVSRISSGKIGLHKETVVLAHVVNGAVEANRSLIDASGIELALALPASPVYLNADATRLTQVLSNLLHNACKFTPPGGGISLTADLTTPPSDGRSELRLSVKDTGVGIPPDMLTRVFDLFEQVGNEQRAKGGLGIGLTLARRLVEMHDGRIEAQSGGVGRGSEFILHLPVQTGDEVRIPYGGGEALQGPGAIKRRVLIVDDNRDAADSLASMVALLGGEVRTAHDGPSGVDAAASFRPDVILLDIGLPGLDGYEACRKIRALPWGKEILLIALTGWGKDEDKRRADDAGFNLHLMKPADPTELKRFLTEPLA